MLFALQYFVRLQKTLTAFKAICSIKSLINDKKAERLAKRRERRRQRLLEETAEEREARLETGHFLRIRQWGGQLQKGTILYQVWRNDKWLLVTKI